MDLVSSYPLADTPEEQEFRQRYALELRNKKMKVGLNPHFGSDEISDELARVKRQMMITPGRRGEQIKAEEIANEILRRNNQIR